MTNLVGNVVGGTLSTALGMGILSYLREKNKSEILYKIMKEPRLDNPKEHTDLPLEVVKSFPNAFYVRGPLTKGQKNNLKWRAEVAMKKGNKPLSDALIATYNLSDSPKGGIVVGEPFANKSIIKHEEGHALDTSWLSSIAPAVERAWNNYNLNLVGTLGALGVGMAYPHLSDAAMTTNLVAQGLSAIPTLYSEYKASDHASKFPGVSKDLLDETYRSYLLRKLGDRLVIPSVAFVGSKLGEKVL